MGIPESQLDSWAHQGSVAQSSNTYNAIKNVLESPLTPYASKSYKVFLQGSYGNNTNIYAESDVDIVIQLDDCWQSDLDALSPEQKAAYHKAYPDATYTYTDFKRDVLKTLRDEYEDDIDPGSKAIAIKASGSRRKADVIASIQFRRYYKFNSTYDQNYNEGICFFNAAGQRITNYPKQHSANLSAKHQNTASWLKPMIRVLKNLRGKLVDDGKLASGLAPSYYLEGLLYNVPPSKFGTSYKDCFVNAIDWIQEEADKSKLLCANEQYYLLRENSNVCWPATNCEQFLNAAIDLWNNW